MKKIKVYNMEGSVVGEQELTGGFWDMKENMAVLHQVINAMMANLRKPLAHTKTRGEVRGGGRKPWKQKGTGRARHGSIRSPIWVGGGITFGPRKDRDYSQKINQKMKRAAVQMLLANKVKTDKLVVLDVFTLPAPKTNTVKQILNKLPSGQAKTFLALPVSDKTINRSVANLDYIWSAEVNNINPLDLMRYGFLVTTVAGLKKIEEKFSAKK